MKATDLKTLLNLGYSLEEAERIRELERIEYFLLSRIEAGSSAPGLEARLAQVQAELWSLEAAPLHEQAA